MRHRLRWRPGRPGRAGDRVKVRRRGSTSPELPVDVWALLESLDEGEGRPDDDPTDEASHRDGYGSYQGERTVHGTQSRVVGPSWLRSHQNQP